MFCTGRAVWLGSSIVMAHISPLSAAFIEIRAILMITSLEEITFCGTELPSDELAIKVFEVANNEVMNFINKDGPIYSKIPSVIYPTGVYTSEQILSMNSKKSYNAKYIN